MTITPQIELATGKKSVKWLNRELMHCPKLCLVLTEEAYLKALRSVGVAVSSRGHWLAGNAEGGCMTSCKDSGGRTVCIVAIRPGPEQNWVEIFAMIAHEAVHVFQRYCEDIGEAQPSMEFEAYSIEKLTIRLVYEYCRQTNNTHLLQPSNSVVKPSTSES